jgi:chemotaxis protein MotB
MTTKAQPIIIVKKKGGHGGHHGGAWKVAYADFVTAMMALFIVLWLMGSSEKVKKAVSGYFNDPKGTGQLLGTTMTGTGDAVQISEANAKALQDLKEKLEKEIQQQKELQKLANQVEITITAEGLRIELIEGKNGTFFQSGSAQLSDKGQELLALLAAELKTLPNKLQLEGHTDAAQYSNGTSYSNWELSADRANSARRLLQQDGVRADQVTQVRGYADQLLHVKDNPLDPSNRRVSILVQNYNGAPPKLVNGHAVDGAASGMNAPVNLPPANAGEQKGGESKPAAGKPEAKPETKPPAGQPAAAQPAVKPAQEPTKAAPVAPAKPATPAKSAAGTQAAKPGLLDKLKALLPGGKK